MNVRYVLATLLFCAGFTVHSQAARAAESYDNCAGTISSLPAVITTQGVWCLKKDLSTAIATGFAIYIGTNNVTIDCNDFKLGGLAAGEASQAIGIYASSRQNITIRHCSIRGFRVGIEVLDGAGHLIENNRLDNNLYVGIFVTGDNSRIRRNAVYDTGGAMGGTDVIGINSHGGSIVDNEVSGLFADKGGGSLTGISSLGANCRIEGNAISGFNLTAVDGASVPGAIGIQANREPMTVANNRVFGADKTVGYGIRGISASTDFCLGNTATGFYYGIDSCNNSGNMLAGNTVN